jgi:hypothetical protein
MSENTTQNAQTQTDKTADAAASLVDTLFDLGVGWAAAGLKVGKAALEQSAKTLAHTAKALENIASELEKSDKSEPAKG